MPVEPADTVALQYILCPYQFHKSMRMRVFFIRLKIFPFDFPPFRLINFRKKGISLKSSLNLCKVNFICYFYGLFINFAPSQNKYFLLPVLFPEF
jgi:hypothetical protein